MSDPIERPERGITEMRRAQGDTMNPDLDRPEPGETRTRAEAAITLRLYGASWSEIAQQLGYSSGTRARMAFERALAEASNSPETMDQARWLANKRLERILRSLMPKGTNPADPDHIMYARTALAIIDRQIRLQGLDAPTETVVYTPQAGQVQEFIASIAAMARENGDASLPGEIIEAEIEED